MNANRFLLTVSTALFTCSIAYAQQEELILSTYYPAPFGEYDEMAAENLFCDRQIIGNMDVNGDGRFSTMDDIALVGGGNLLVENRVGIGTRAPDPFVRLHVMGNDVGGTNLLDDANDPNRRPTIQIEGPYPNLIIKSQGNQSHSSTIGLWAFDGGAETKQWNMGVGQNGLFSMGYCTNQWNPHCGLNNHVTNSVLAMTPAGNVGIGTTSPDQRLEVNGAIEIQVDDADNQLRFHDPGQYWYSMGIDRSDGGKFKLNSGGTIGATNQFTMTPGGNVGIGTTNPGSSLEVNGTITSSGGLCRIDNNSNNFQDYGSVSVGNNLEQELGSVSFSITAPKTVLIWTSVEVRANFNAAGWLRIKVTPPGGGESTLGSVRWHSESISSYRDTMSLFWPYTAPSTGTYTFKITGTNDLHSGGAVIYQHRYLNTTTLY